MRHPILTLGDRQLEQPARPVEAITPATQQLIDDMIETMHAAPGIGLAAPQIGVPLRLFVIDLSVGRTPGAVGVFINPAFVERDGMQLEEEGCLSVPGCAATVLRPARAVVRALDRDGRERRVEGRGLLARAFQHEMDHLDGVLFVHRLRGLQRAVLERRVRTLERLR